MVDISWSFESSDCSVFNEAMCLVSTSPNSIYKFSLELGSGVGNQGVSSSSCLPMEELKWPLETFWLAYAWWFL